MAQPITLNIPRNPDYYLGDTFQIEIDGAVQPDVLLAWGPTRATMGEGFGVEHQTGEGFGNWKVYGEGIEGYGWDGNGADLMAHETTGAFVAGDYAVRIRGIDAPGN